MTAETLVSVRELDARVSDGIQVRLLWSDQSDAVWVSVLDMKTGDGFRLTVAAHESAHDVFHHPFAYADEVRARPLATHSERHGIAA